MHNESLDFFLLWKFKGYVWILIPFRVFNHLQQQLFHTYIIKTI